jgi:hypothetical protein
VTQTQTPKARRLVLLYRLRMAGVLEKLTLRQIGQMLGVSRATLISDLRDLDKLEGEFRDLLEAEPWKELAPEASPSDWEEDEVETLKRLTRDGLVWLENWAAPKDADV